MKIKRNTREPYAGYHQNWHIPLPKPICHSLVTIYSASDNGLYLEATWESEPDDDILNHALNHTPLGITAKLLSGNVGTIGWLNAIQTDTSHCSYGTGIRFYQWL